MGQINSPVRAIEELYFYEWNKAFRSGALVPVTAIVRADDVTIVKTKRGLACSHLRNFYYSGGNPRGIKSILKGLQALKVITKKDVETHLEWVEKTKAEDEKRSDLHTLGRLEKKYGNRLMALRSQRRRDQAKEKKRRDRQEKADRQEPVVSQ